MTISMVHLPAVAAAAIVAAALDGRRSSVLGSWHRLVVGATKVAPGVLAHVVARTSVEGQQTDEPCHGDRPANLWKPVDDDCDAGAQGRFGDDAHGFLTTSFLRTVPSTATHLVRAAADTAAEKVHVAARRLRT